MTRLEGVETAADIAGGQVDERGEDAGICLKGLPLADFAETLDEELRLRFAESDDACELAEGPKRRRIADDQCMSGVTDATHRSLQMQMIGLRNGFAGVPPAASATSSNATGAHASC